MVAAARAAGGGVGGLRLLLPSGLPGQVLEQHRASVSPSLLPLGRGVCISG